jgi:ERCC4-type nuclease
MIVLCDTREQKRLDFSEFPGVTSTRVQKLDFGDYCVEFEGKLAGMKAPIVVERKSLGDLWGTMTSGYPRFRREMERAKEAKTKLVLAVEANYADVLQGFDRSEFTGDSMVQKLATLWAKYDVETWYAGSRKLMARMVYEAFASIGRHYAKTA